MLATLHSSTQNTITLEEIWVEYAQTRNVHLLDLLTVQYLPLVRMVAARIAARLPRLVDLDDLIQEGTLGLRRGIELFDPAKGAVVKTYVMIHIRGAILDSLRDKDWTPRLVQARSRKVEEATRVFEMRTGRKPTEQELADAMRLSGKSLKVVMKDGMRVVMGSLSRAYFQADSGKAMPLGQTLADERALDPVRAAQAADLRNLISQGLTRGERLILMLYYYENMTMREIGLTLDLSESRVSQIHTLLVQRLKVRMMGKEIEFLPLAG